MLEGRNDAALRDDGQVGEFRALFDPGIGPECAAVADRASGSDVDRTDNHFVPDHGDVGKPRLETGTGMVANGDQIDRARLELGNDRVPADPRTERSQIERHQRGALQELERRDLDEASHEPESEVIDAPERIASRLGPPITAHLSATITAFVPRLIKCRP